MDFSWEAIGVMATILGGMVGFGIWMGKISSNVTSIKQTVEGQSMDSEKQWQHIDDHGKSLAKHSVEIEGQAKTIESHEKRLDSHETRIGHLEGNHG